MATFSTPNEYSAPDLGFTALSAAELNAITPMFDAISFADCRRRGVLIGHRKFEDTHQCVLVSTSISAHFDLQFAEVALERTNPQSVARALIAASEFQTWLDAVEATLKAMDSVSIQDSGGTSADQGGHLLSLSMVSIEANENPIVRLVDSTLYDALKIGASDVHFEVQNKVLHIKYRLDGVLQSVKKVEGSESAAQVVSRIKVLADLDISERRVPQDGRFRVRMDGREIDFRVSVMPNITSEDAVLRILDRKHLTGQFAMLTLDSLSFEPDVKAFIRNASKLPYGLLIVTGPTGSGKTTTLYAALSEINSGLDKIITIEDPIEYQLPGILQIPVNEKKGLTFATGLRSVLRHDPDKIMVGEIRDEKTAEIAVQAALTGHQVFTTLHANNAFDVIGRFVNMKVDIYTLVAALSGVVAQRLVRKLCNHCAIPANVSTEVLRELGVEQVNLGDYKIMRAIGCEQCRGTGFKGRSAIAETLHIDDEMKGLLISNAPISAIKAAARAKGFKSLRDSAVSMVLRGESTLDEINRVTPTQD